MKTLNKKDQSIETLRGLAIILMVSGHVIGHDSGSGLQVGDGSALRHFYYSFEFLRMPLFTVISGFVYALRPVSRDSISRFLKGKSRRLLVPLIAVGSVQFLFKAFLPDINNPVQLHEIWAIYIFPFEHFWFLQSLLIVFFVISMLEFYRTMNSFNGWILTFLGSIVLYFSLSWLNIRFFSFDNFLYLLPHFILGVGLNRFSRRLFDSASIFLCASLFFTGVVIVQSIWFFDLEITSFAITALVLLAGFAGNVLLFRLRFPLDLMAKIGTYAFGIYLFHVFGTAGARILLQYLGVESNLFLFFGSLAAGLSVPIAIQTIINRSVILQSIFFGHPFSFEKRKKPVPLEKQVETKNSEQEAYLVKN